MKIIDEHYQYMRESIQRLGIEKIKHHKADLLFRVNGYGDIDKRVRWDALHAAGLTPWVCKHLYEYANDSHIDTALRHIMADLGID